MVSAVRWVRSLESVHCSLIPLQEITEDPGLPGSGSLLADTGAQVDGQSHRSTLFSGGNEEPTAQQRRRRTAGDRVTGGKENLH